MQAIVYNTKGPAAEVLQLVERARPEPGPGEVRVALAFSGVNPSDVKSRAGTASSQLSYSEVIPHSDGAGVIDAVGAGVDAGRIGQRVWLYNAQWERAHGTAAQAVVLPSAQAVALPDDVGLEVGASVGIPRMTAFHAVARCGSLLGRTVLVTGGAGAVGAYAVQLAQRAGARVIATISSLQKADRARALGAAETVNYKEEDLVARVRELSGGQGVDALIDVDAAGHAPLYGSLIREGGRAVIYGSNKPQFQLGFGPMILGGITLDFFIVYKLRDAALRETVEGVSLLLRQQLQHPPLSIYPLAECAAAHQQVERGADAKVLLKL
ncbi:NADPH:quinone reductase [Piscinibacter sakaiensis]|uniref:NADPH:quinone reductase n=1 Tax=Piscinibacter sakaiensis TaxID=1547922 RepID=UPI003AAF386B